MTETKEWHEDESQTPLCEPNEEKTADEMAKDADEVTVNQWGEEDAEGWILPLGVNAL